MGIVGNKVSNSSAWRTLIISSLVALCNDTNTAFLHLFIEHSPLLQGLDHRGTWPPLESTLAMSFLWLTYTTPSFGKWDKTNFHASSFFHCMGLLMLGCGPLHKKQNTWELVESEVCEDTLQRLLPL